jgi:ribonuclease HII
VRLSRRIEERALAVSVFEASHDLVDRVNVYQATVQAMLGALRGLAPDPDALLVDGMRLPVPGLHQRSIAGGDAAVASIAAASIVAKVRRDALMQELHREYPAYNFASNKGYGTQEHRSALAAFGPCPYHRASFRGVGDPYLPFPGRAAVETS